MSRTSNHRGLYVHVHREGDGQDLFRWNIYRRKPPLGVKLTEGGFTSFHAAHAAGSKALEELVERILEEEKEHGITRSVTNKSLRTKHFAFSNSSMK